MNNLITAAFPPGETFLRVYASIYQWDYGQILRIQGLNLPAAVEVHFAHEGAAETVTRVGAAHDGVTDVPIPDSILECPGSFYAYVFLADGESGNTEYKVMATVRARPKPTEYEPPTPQEETLFRETVRTVSLYASQAEAAGLSAEAWAHGRDDTPERKEDNASYYAKRAESISERLQTVVDAAANRANKASVDAEDAASKANLVADQLLADKQAGEFTGPVGPQGRAGTIKVGKVSTLQPGEDAIVENTGTAENAVLDFGIPRGSDGLTDLVAEYRDSEYTAQPTVEAPVVIKGIEGKTVQNGTPTPDTPVPIQGVGDAGHVEVVCEGMNSFKSTITIPLSSPLYTGDRICYVRPGETYVDAAGNEVVADRISYGVWRENRSVMLDGSAEEEWFYDPDIPQFGIPIADMYFDESRSTVSCSVFTRAARIARGMSDDAVYASEDASAGKMIAVKTDRWASVADFKAWLQGNPIKVIYKLVVPYFKLFPDQDLFYRIRSAVGRTHIHTNDPLGPELAVDVARNQAGAYLLEGYANGTAEKTSGLETAIENYYALRRTGKVYQTKVYKFASNASSAGEKLLDNAGLVCMPSTDTTEERDDYAGLPLFQWCNVNYIRDTHGFPHPTAIEWQEGYKISGSVDVGCMQMSFWINIDTSNAAYDLWTISDMPHPELGLVPYPGAVRADGTMAPYIIHSKYVSGIASDGLLRSQPGLKPEKFQSYERALADYQKKGDGYWGSGIERNLFQIVFQIIKYATKNSQTVMRGCTDYNFQFSASIQMSDSQTYFPVSNGQDGNIIIGSYVSVGYGSDSGDAINNDRGTGTMHEYADDVKVLRITELDANNKAVYLDVEEGFPTTPIALTSTLNAPIMISSMHWWSGTTDKVKGHHDGSMISNTNGRYPYRMQGLEYALGGYIVASDAVIIFNENHSKDVYVAHKGTPHSSSESVIRSTYKCVGNIPAYTDGGDWWIGDIAVDLATGGWYPSAVGSSDAQGVGDRIYAGGMTTSGTREFVQGGGLWLGSTAGAALLDCGAGLGGAYWGFLSCD